MSLLFYQQCPALILRFQKAEVDHENCSQAKFTSASTLGSDNKMCVLGLVDFFKEVQHGQQDRVSCDKLMVTVSWTLNMTLIYQENWDVQQPVGCKGAR